MSLSPEYYHFRELMGASQEPMPRPMVEAIDACHQPGCVCDRQKAVRVLETYLDSHIAVEALIFCLRIAAERVWGTE